MTCDHEKSKVFALKTFSNNTQHICIQCLKCGSTVKYNGKTWLKPEDVPHGKTGEQKARCRAAALCGANLVPDRDYRAYRVFLPVYCACALRHSCAV